MKTRWMKKSLSLLLALVLCLSVLSPAALAAEDLALPEEQNAPAPDAQLDGQSEAALDTQPETLDEVPVAPEAQPGASTPVENDAGSPGADPEAAPAGPEVPAEPTPDEPEVTPDEPEAEDGADEALPEELEAEGRVSAFLAANADVVASGTCGAQGDNLTWTLDKNGTLTISGTGDMAYFTSGSSPWDETSYSVKTVLLSEGITSIGNNAFYNCYNLTSISIPDSVTAIGSYAFFCCSALPNVTIPNSVTAIYYGTFSSCTSLTSISIPDSVTFIGEAAFSNCDALIKVSIPDSVTAIGSGAFLNCRSLERIFYGGTKADWEAIGGKNAVNSSSVLVQCSDGIYEYPSSRLCGENLLWSLDGSGVLTISGSGDMYDYPGSDYTPWHEQRDKIKTVQLPEGLTSIGEYAFSSCTSLTSITIPNNVTSIGDFAFYYCSFTNVALPDSLTSIGNWAFQCCDSLTSITIPGSLNAISSGAFSYCSALTSVTIQDGVTSIGFAAFDGCSALTDITIPGSVTSIGNQAFCGCALTSITIPNSVTSIGFAAFQFCSALKQVSFGGTKDAWTASGGSEAVDRYSVTIHCSDGDLAPTDPRYCGKNLTWALDGDGVLTISGSGDMFDFPQGYAPWDKQLEEIKTVLLPEGLTSIGSFAFDGCALTGITIPDGVASIGNNAFSNCTSLASITLPDSLTSIGSGAFFFGSSLTSITIPGSVTSIGEMAFYNCSGLKSVYLQGSLPAIDNGAFFYVAATVYYHSDDPSYTAEARKSYGGDLTWKAYPTGTCGAQGANLTWTLEAGDTLIISGKGDMADFDYGASPWYSYREAIRTLVVQPGVTSIGNYAFENCSALRRVELPNGLTRLGRSAFYFCRSLKELQLPETLISIERVVLNDTALESLYIPASVTHIEGDAFWWNAQLARYDVAPENPVYQSIDGVIFSKDGTQLLQYPDARQGAYTVPAGVTTIGACAFYGSQGLTSVSLPDTLTTLKPFAFGESGLSSILLPASLSSVGFRSLYGFPAPLTVAPDSPFFTAVDGVLYSKDMTELVAATQSLQGSFSIPSSVTRVCAGACVFTRITGLTIPRSVKTIEDSAFFGGDSLTEIRFEHLRDDPLTIADLAFNVWQSASIATNITAFFSDQVGMNETIASYDWAGAGRSVSFLPAPVQNHSVVYVLNGGTNSPANPERYSSLDTISLAAPTRPGYAFAGWYASEDFSGDPVAVLSGGVPAAVYAKWSPIEYSIHFEPNGGSGTIRDLHGCETDVRYPLPESGFTRTGHSLAGWNTAPDGSGAAYLPGEEVVNLCSVPDGSVTLYAIWTPNSYAIAFDGNGADGEAMAPMETLFGQNTALPACALSRTGYHFTGWNTRADGKGTAYADGVTVLSLTAEAGGVVTLYAQWSPNAYTVRFDANGGTGSMAAQPMTYDKEAALRANAFKKASHVFLGWATEPDALSPLYLDKQKVSNLTAAQDGELTLYAVWAKYSYQIVFNANGGSGDMADDGGFCEYDGVYTLPACGFTREGFDFLGWATSAKGKVVYQDGQSIQGLSSKNGTVIKLFAVWQAHSYRVVFDGNGGTGTMKALSCTCGKVYTLTANAFKRTGYTFAGWNTAPDGSGSAFANKAKQMNFATDNGALLTLYAQWTPTEYKITYKNLDASELNPNPAVYTIESETIVLAPAFRPGCDFAGWFSDAKFKTPVTEIAAGGTGARTLYAKWVGTANTYGIVFDPNGGTGTTKAMAKLSCGKAYALTANAFKRAGYTFAGWNTAPDGSGTAYANKEKVANLSVENGGSVTLFAQWTPVVYKITYKNALYDGNTNPATFTPESETIVLAPVSRAGCVFGGWFTDAKFKTPITEIATGRVGNLTLYAKWTGKAATYTIAFDGNGASSGKMKEMTKRACGSAYALTANAFKRTGYSFAGWNTAPDSSGAAYANKEKVANLCHTDGGTVTLYAQWTPIAYTINYKNIGPALTPEKTSYTIEESFELPTPVKVGHAFLGWYSTATFMDGTQIRSIAPGTTGNLTLYAKWMLLRG